jgi:hypothetical protein
MKCDQHKPIYDHASKGLVAVRCAHCNRPWFGNPQAKNAPRWVRDELQDALDAIAEKARRPALKESM